MKKNVVSEICAAKSEFDVMLSGKKTADGEKIDAHIENAANILGEALKKLEEMREQDNARAGEPGHQLRVRLIIDYVKEYELYTMTPEDIDALFRPISFDPTVETMLRHMYDWDRKYKKALTQLAEIFNEVRIQANAISVLKSHEKQVRSLRSKIECTENIGDTATNVFDSILDTLEGWNDDLTQYGGNV